MTAAAPKLRDAMKRLRNIHGLYANREAGGVDVIDAARAVLAADLARRERKAAKRQAAGERPAVDAAAFAAAFDAAADAMLLAYGDYLGARNEVAEARTAKEFDAKIAALRALVLGDGEVTP